MDRRQHLLVVDDDADTRTLLLDLLEGEGFHVTLSPGGIDALEHLRRLPFDGVLLDLRMNDIHGTVVIRRIRHLWPDTPVVIVTAHPPDATLWGAFAAGAKALVKKPFARQELLNSIESALKPVAGN